MRNRILIIIATILIASIAYLLWKNSGDSITPSKKLQASIRFGWIPSASFTGEVVGSVKFASKYNLDLKCEPGGPGLNSIQLVQTDQNTFGTLAADEVLAANDKGADFVIIGVINYFSPGGFISLAEKNINNPEDFKGKKIGLLPFGSTTLLYESLLKKNNIDKSTVTEITVSPDLKPFLNGSYDVHPVFVYDETVTLDQLGIKYNLIEPKEFGVKMKGPVYFCKRETLQKSPEVVEAFIRTVAEGWNYAIQKQDSSIVILKKYAPEIDVEREGQVLRKAIPYYSAYKSQPLNSDYESWKEMIEELKQLKVIKNSPNLSKVLQLKYINDYYLTK